MKPILLIAVAPLILAGCNMMPNGGYAGSGNTSAAVPATPDSVVVNGVTYVRAGSNAANGNSPAGIGGTTPTGVGTPPNATPSSGPAPIEDDTTTAPPAAPSSAQPDGVRVTGGH